MVTKLVATIILFLGAILFMEQFNTLYNIFIDFGLTHDLANISSCCALAFMFIIAVSLFILFFYAIGYLIGFFIADKKYYLYFNETHYFCSFGKSKFGLKRMCKKHLFKYKYAMCFYNKLDMFVFINQMSLLPINIKSLGELWIL